MTIWDDPDYQEQMVEIANHEAEFVRFVNMLMNDTTFLLDEAIGSLKTIHEIQGLFVNDFHSHEPSSRTIFKAFLPKDSVF